MTSFKNTLKTSLYLFFLALLYSCAQEKITKAAVVSARAEASEIGVAIMRKGGSAFEALSFDKNLVRCSI